MTFWTDPLPDPVPVAADDAAMRGHLYWQDKDGSFNPSFGPNVYLVTEDDPVATIVCATGNCTGLPATFRVPASGVVPSAAGGDGHVAIVDLDAGLELDLWKASWDPATSTLTGQGGALFPLDGSGWVDCPQHPPWCSSARASGAALTAGMLTPHDLHNGIADHALAFIIRFTRPGFVAAPATHTDGKGLYSDDPPEGARVFIPRSWPIPADWSRTAMGRVSAVVVRTLQTYGAYIIDQGAIGFPAHANADWSGTDLAGGPLHFPRGWWVGGEPTAFPWNQIRFMPYTRAT